MRHLIKPAIIAILTFAFISPAVASERWKEFYSNVTAKDGYKLLNDVVNVSYFNVKNLGDVISVTWYGKDQISHTCSVYGKNDTRKIYKEDFRFMMIDVPKYKIKYPLINFRHDEEKGFFTIRYDATDGAFTKYILWKKRWWKETIGHLQKRLPAATWTACPDFPSAKSLGAKVNTKQTSTDYKELIEQDSGRRILRPDLVTEDTVVRY